MLVSLKFQKPVSAIQISFRRRRFPPLDSKATLVPFFLFYYLFFFFLCRSGRKESLKISTREKFVCWNSDYRNPFVRWSFTYRHRFFKEEDTEIFVLFLFFFFFTRLVNVNLFRLTDSEFQQKKLTRIFYSTVAVDHRPMLPTAVNNHRPHKKKQKQKQNRWKQSNDTIVV